MNKGDIEAAIEARLREREKAVLNRNAIGALFGAFTDPIAALGQVFLGRGDAIDQEKQHIAQDIILDLLCRIDETLSQANAKSEQQGIKLGGLIETIARGGESVIGLSIGAKSGPVTLQPGTHVRTVATGVRNVVGVKKRGRRRPWSPTFLSAITAHGAEPQSERMPRSAVFHRVRAAAVRLSRRAAALKRPSLPMQGAITVALVRACSVPSAAKLNAQIVAGPYHRFERLMPNNRIQPTSLPPVLRTYGRAAPDAVR